MSLLSPWFLAGLVAVGLPLWLHLMRQRNPVRLSFSSLMFFRKRAETTLREKRLQYLLLLAMRLALLLLLALAFSKPIWERPPAAILGDIPKLHIIAVDTSLSMQYEGRWEQALEEAEAIVDALGESDRGLVMANGPSVHVLTAPTGDRVALRQALAGLVPSDARNSFGDVIEAVRAVVADETLPVEVHLVSDLQNSSMPARFQDLVLPSSSELTVHDVSAGQSDNWAIDSVKGSTRLHGEMRPKLEVTVASFAESDQDRTVSLQIDGRPAGTVRKPVPAGGRATFGFEIADPPRGFSRAEFHLDPPDHLTADDVRRVALDNSEPELILIVSQDPRGRDLLYYREALESGASSRFRLEAASPAEAERIDPGRFSLVVLSDVPRLGTAFAGRLQEWVESGGALLVALGPASTLARRTPVTGHVLEQPLSTERGASPFQVAGQADSSHWVASAAEGLRPVKFFLYARVHTMDGDTVPLWLGNGDPLLVERQVGSGRAMIFASSLDNVWNDLPLTPVFVPFVTEAADSLTGAEGVRGDAILGEVLELGRRRGTGATVQVFDPSETAVLNLSDSVTRETLALESVGFYEVRGGHYAELLAVNPDPRESDLRRIGEDTLELWRSTGASEPSQVAAAGVAPASVPPLRIWRLLLCLLLLAALVESFVGNRHLHAVRGD